MLNFNKSKLVLATSVIVAGLSGCSSNQSADSTDADDAGLVSMKEDKQQQNVGADQSAVYNTSDADAETDSSTAMNEQANADDDRWQRPSEQAAPPSPISQTVTFELDSAELTEEAKRTLRNSLQNAAEIPLEAELVGYTDDTGPEQYNQDLSQRRAQSVRDYLASEIDADINDWEVEGRGEQSPTASNDSEWGRAQNRRVSITLTPTERQAQQADF